MNWRVAKSLLKLRAQVDAKYPNRDKSSDGTIGDTSHQASKSDHNPNAAGVVTAMDISHDPAHGLNARSLAEALVASRDRRIKYIISNAQIISSVQSPWVWRPYTGVNAHRHHVHISVMADSALYDDEKPWVGVQTPAQAPASPSPTATPTPVPLSPRNLTTGVTMNPLTIISLIPTILRLVNLIRGGVQTGLSFKSLADLLSNPEVLEIFKQLGAVLFPLVNPKYQAVAAIAATYSPDYVKKVQNAANQLLTPSPNLDVDGLYGEKTRAAVEKVQKQLNLTPADGWAGDQTLAAMQTALAKVVAPMPTPVVEVPKV